jgi:ubiquinone biosynthesis monooxygenase Coq7
MACLTDSIQTFAPLDANSTTCGGTPLGNRILKVNHAGEHGAVSIYTGQILLARLTARDLLAELIEFRAHERAHRKIFQDELQRRGHPRCKSYWLCGLGGLMLGAITALFGRKAIAATTVAVEAVVLRHLKKQVAQLVDQDEAAVAAIRAIIKDEQQHHDQSASHLRPSSFWSRLVTPVVSAATEAVIWLGMRL